MFKYHGVGIVLFLIVGLWFGCTQNPVATNGGDPGTITIGSTYVYLKSDPSNIVQVINGSYNLIGSGCNLKGKVTFSDKAPSSLGKRLAKMAVDSTFDAIDTLIIKKDSVIYESKPISSLVDSLPTTTIVGRSIGGSFGNTQGWEQVKKIEFLLWDVSKPSYQKTYPCGIITQNNEIKSYSGFAFFTWDGEQNRKYAFYVKVYDANGRMIGRSEEVNFDGIAADIPVSPFSITNAKPTIEVIAPVAVATGTDSVSITVKATDSLGGKIVSCKIYTNTTDSITVQRNGNGAVAKRAANDSVDVFVGTVKIPVVSGAVAVVIDNDGNILKGDIMVDIVEPQISVDFLAYKNGLQMSVLKEGDTVELRSSSYIAPVVDFTITKVQWFYDNAVIGNTETIKYIIPHTPAGECTLSVKVESNLGKTATNAKRFDVCFASVAPVVHASVPVGSKPIMEQNGLTFTCTNVSVFAPVSKAVYIIGFGAPVTFDINSPVTVVVPANTTVGTKVYFQVHISSGEYFYSEYPL